MNSKEIWTALARPFDRTEVRSRSRAGQQLTYITSRSAMNRLDEVLGPENWAEEYEILDQRQQDRMSYAVARCRLTITVGDRSVSRIDVGGAGNPDPLVALKGAYSDALKRAAVKFGVGRHLYGDGIPDYDEAEIEEAAPQPKAAVELSARPPTHANDRLPTTGKGLWAWLKGLENQGEDWAKSLSYRVMNHFKKENYPGDLSDWTPSHVAEACRYVDTIRHTPAVALKPKAAKTERRLPPITYDENGSRVTPLIMTETISDSELADAAEKLKLLAMAAGLASTVDFVGAICRAAGEDGKAPYLKGMDIDLREGIRQYALLKKHFPEWLKVTVKATVAQFKAKVGAA